MEELNVEDLSKKEQVDYKFKKYDEGEIHDKALEFLKYFNIYTIRTDDERKRMYIYDKSTGMYLSDGASYIKELCSKNRTTSNKKFVDSFIYHIQNNTFINDIEFVPPKHLVNLKNGVFNIEDGKLMPHDPKYKFQTILNIPYEENAKCPMWETALHGMMPDQKIYERTQKWFGYQFIKGNRDQVAHGYFGEAKSGKSTMLMILRDLLGHQNVTSFQIQEFANPNMYALARLYGKYANITYDMSTMKIKDISTFKSITSGDPIEGRSPYKPSITFVNEAKITWGCNSLPVIPMEVLETEEFRRRIMLTEIVKGHGISDKDLYMKFLKELPGIFNWASEGYRMYLNKGFEYNDNIYDVWIANMEGNRAKKINTNENNVNTNVENNKNKVKVVDNDELWDELVEYNRRNAMGFNLNEN